MGTAKMYQRHIKLCNSWHGNMRLEDGVLLIIKLQNISSKQERLKNTYLNQKEYEKQFIKNRETKGFPSSQFNFLAFMPQYFGISQKEKESSNFLWPSYMLLIYFFPFPFLYFCSFCVFFYFYLFVVCICFYSLGGGNNTLVLLLF